MQIETHKQYDKAWAKLKHKQQLQILAAIEMLLTDPSHSKLRLHRLKGIYYPQYSMSVGGDLRVHYLKVNEKKIVLMLVGTHSQLYG